MKNFHFQLARVLEWRGRQLEAEEAKLEPLLRERTRILAERSALENDERRARDGCSANVTERAALAVYVRHVSGEQKRVAARLTASEDRIRKQQESIQTARRNLRLLESLERRRRSEWQALADREQEALAQELFVARMAHTRGSSS